MNITVLQEIFDWALNSSCVNELELKMPVNQCCSEEYDNLVKTNIIETAADTQKNRTLWHKQRQFRITGSRCYGIFTYSKTDWHTKAIKYFWPKPFTNK